MGGFIRDFLTKLHRPCGKKQTMDSDRILCYNEKKTREGCCVEALLQKLSRDHRLTTGEYAGLIESGTNRLRQMADRVRRENSGTRAALRAVLDVSSICQHDCPHCTQRCSADPRIRYRLRPREILDSCEEAWGLELRSIVLRCGTDRFYSDEMLLGILEKLRRSCPELSVTIAMGERSRRSYERLFNAGAEGYILLQETANREQYEKIHSENLSFDRRLHCLNEIRDVGFRTGCGFLMGLPGQRAQDLARELKFLEEFQPDLVELVCLTDDPALRSSLISLIRLILPRAAVTASGDGAGNVLAGADLLSVSLTGGETYPLCGGTPAGEPASIESLAALQQQLAGVGFEITTDPMPWNG